MKKTLFEKVELENQKLRKHVHAKMLQTLSDQGVFPTHIAQL